MLDAAASLLIELGFTRSTGHDLPDEVDALRVRRREPHAVYYHLSDLPRAADVNATVVEQQDIDLSEFADVCQAIGDDFGTALAREIPLSIYAPRLKSIVSCCSGARHWQNGQSASWQMLSACLR